MIIEIFPMAGHDIGLAMGIDDDLRLASGEWQTVAMPSTLFIAPTMLVAPRRLIEACRRCVVRVAPADHMHPTLPIDMFRRRVHLTPQEAHRLHDDTRGIDADRARWVAIQPRDHCAGIVAPGPPVVVTPRIEQVVVGGEAVGLIGRTFPP